QVQGVCSGGEAKEGGGGPSRAACGGQRAGGRVASADGNGGSQRDLQGESSNRRTGQRASAESRLDPFVGPRRAKGQGSGIMVRHRPQHGARLRAAGFAIAGYWHHTGPFMLAGNLITVSEDSTGAT